MDTTDLSPFRRPSLDTPMPPFYLLDIVRAASAGDTGEPWRSALRCRRRPGRKACPGRMVVSRTTPDLPIHWRCDGCGDEGVISNWADSLYDLRRRGLRAVDDVRTITVDNATASALRDLQLLDRDCERLVFAMRADRDAAVLRVSPDDFDQLIEAVAAESNHESSPSRRRRLDAAFGVLDRIAGRL